MTDNNPVDQAIQSNLVIMEMYLQDMMASVQTAQKDLAEYNRNTAIGGLLNSGNQFTDIKALYDNTLILQKAAALVEKPKS